MNNTPDFTVYESWPQQAVREALAEFKSQMYDGAEVVQLQAGIRCFDFLCRRSDLDQELLEDIKGAMTQAQMRIELMLQAQTANRTEEENFQRALQSVESLRREVRSLQQRFFVNGYGHSGDPDAIHAAIEKRVLDRRRLALR